MGIGDYSYEQIPYSVMEMGWLCSSVSIPVGLLLGRLIRKYLWKTPISTFPRWSKKQIKVQVQGTILLAVIAACIILSWPVARIILSFTPIITSVFSLPFFALPTMPDASRIIEGAEYRSGVIFAFSFASFYLFCVLSTLLDITKIFLFLFCVTPVFLMIPKVLESLDILILTSWVNQLHWEYYLFSIPAWALIEVSAFLAMSSIPAKTPPNSSSNTSSTEIAN